MGKMLFYSEHCFYFFFYFNLVARLESDMERDDFLVLVYHQRIRHSHAG